MPELPEVEVTRLSFVDRIAGAKILCASLGKPLRWPLGCACQQLVGRSIETVRRRGKYLLIDLDEGLLMVHLGMSGSLIFASHLPPSGVHDHFELITSNGILRLNDPRRFGAVIFVSGEAAPEAHVLLSKLGMEPLSGQFDLGHFQVELKRRRAPIKQVLLAGHVVVGVGNIYASEALFLSGIRPTVASARLSRSRTAKLHAAIQSVLASAVAKGGSTLRDFSSAAGEDGHFQLDAMVYARAGQPCRVCASLIKSMRQGQRSTFYCPTCQRA